VGHLSTIATKHTHKTAPGKESSGNIKEWPYYIILLLLVIFSLGPLLLLFMNSLKSDAERGVNPLGIPMHPLLSNYIEAWEQGNFATTMPNSIIISLSTVVGVCILAGMASYAMTRLNLPGGAVVILYLFAGSSLPAQLFLVPLYFLWNSLNLIDSLPGLIVIYLATLSPFATLLLRSYMLSISREFDEAAYIDGANKLQVLIHIILPLSWPGLLTVALTTALASWNEFFFAVTFIQREKFMPISTSFLAFQQAFTRNWGLTNAAAIITIAPMIILFLFFQRRFIAGLASGGLKG
jgi:raffinose/stachyose/melibiose transport system permease protein